MNPNSKEYLGAISDTWPEEEKPFGVNYKFIFKPPTSPDFWEKINQEEEQTSSQENYEEGSAENGDNAQDDTQLNTSTTANTDLTPNQTKTEIPVKRALPSLPLRSSSVDSGIVNNPPPRPQRLHTTEERTTDILSSEIPSPATKKPSDTGNYGAIPKIPAAELILNASNNEKPVSTPPPHRPTPTPPIKQTPTKTSVGIKVVKDQPKPETSQETSNTPSSPYGNVVKVGDLLKSSGSFPPANSATSATSSEDKEKKPPPPSVGVRVKKDNDSPLLQRPLSPSIGVNIKPASDNANVTNASASHYAVVPKFSADVIPPSIAPSPKVESAYQALPPKVIKDSVIPPSKPTEVKVESAYQQLPPKPKETFKQSRPLPKTTQPPSPKVAHPLPKEEPPTAATNIGNLNSEKVVVKNTPVPKSDVKAPDDSPYKNMPVVPGSSLITPIVEQKTTTIDEARNSTNDNTTTTTGNRSSSESSEFYMSMPIAPKKKAEIPAHMLAKLSSSINAPKSSTPTPAPNPLSTIIPTVEKTNPQPTTTAQYQIIPTTTSNLKASSGAPKPNPPNVLQQSASMACDRCDEKAMKTCVDCGNLPFCESCAQVVHDKGKYTTHVLTTI